jgi:hypothetical protein
MVRGPACGSITAVAARAWPRLKAAKKSDTTPVTCGLSHSRPGAAPPAARATAAIPTLSAPSIVLTRP